tara:strand:- start:9225 stop:10544 length:1320 start_codon:yes stop_codon:yes gene_type:complete
MENARIIKLDAPLTVTVSSFGEAFGEYSELRGRGRKKRQARRQERRMTRISDRATRKRAKQEMRAEQQEARQTRKDTRKTRRLARKEMGADEPEAESTENGAPEPPEGEPMGNPDQYIPGDEGQGGYQPTEESDYEDSEEQNPSEDEESGADGEYYDSFDGTSGIEYDNLGSNDEIYALQDDDFYSFVDESSSADGFSEKRVRARIGKGTKSVAMKSEWNKEMVSRLQDKVDAIDAELNAGTSPERENMLGIKRAKLIENITLHKDRAVSFDGLMESYVNAEGEYSGIDGDYDSEEGEFSEARGKKSAKGKLSTQEVSRRKAKILQRKKKRFAEVSAAKREARKQRVKVRGLATKVSKNLNPKFGKDYIVIPEKEIGKSSAEGTGLIALDDINDFDAPKENEYSLASGERLKNINWKGVLIGIAIAGLAIYGAKKAKLF